MEEYFGFLSGNYKTLLYKVTKLEQINAYLYRITVIQGGSITEDLRKDMIFADFYGLVIISCIVSIHFGLKKLKR